MSFRDTFCKVLLIIFSCNLKISLLVSINESCVITKKSRTVHGYCASTNKPMTQNQGAQMALCQAAHCVLVGKAALLLETESEALFSLKSHKPDAKN